MNLDYSLKKGEFQGGISWKCFHHYGGRNSFVGEISTTGRDIDIYNEEISNFCHGR